MVRFDHHDESWKRLNQTAEYGDEKGHKQSLGGHV